MSEQFTSSVTHDNSLTFYGDGKRILELKSNGDILVYDRLVENDKEVVDAMRAFIDSLYRSGYLK